MSVTVFVGDSITRDWNVQAVVSGAKNSGVGGNRTQDVAARFWEDALSYDPERVVILCGINDIFWEPSPQVAAILAMVNRCLRAGATACVGTILPNSNWTGFRHIANAAAGIAAVDAFNTDLRSLVAGYGGTLIEFHDSFVNGDGSQKTELFDGGLHLNASGYTLLSSLATAALA